MKVINNNIVHQTLMQDLFILPLGNCNWTTVNYNAPGSFGASNYATLSSADQLRLQNQIIVAVKKT